MEKLITVAGFECPASTSEAAKKVLRQLRKHGVVKFTHDDGESLLVRQELEEICGAIGVEYYRAGHYSVIFIDKIKVNEGASLV